MKRFRLNLLITIDCVPQPYFMGIASIYRHRRRCYSQLAPDHQPHITVTRFVLLTSAPSLCSVHHRCTVYTVSLYSVHYRCTVYTISVQCAPSLYNVYHHCTVCNITVQCAPSLHSIHHRCTMFTTASIPNAIEASHGISTA